LRVLGIIPARGGSKGVPRKNIKLLNNKPLIQYTIESALRSKLLTSVIVSTDDIEIAQISISLGAKVPFIRPKKLASDSAKSIDVVLHAIGELEEINLFFDAICLLQPTNPFRENGLIDLCIAKFAKKNYDSLMSVLPVPHQYNPHWVYEPNEMGILKLATNEIMPISRRQDLPAAFYREGSIYITKTEIIKTKKSLYGNKIGFQEIKSKFKVNIDTTADWVEAENLAVQYDESIK
jgi:CMP-N,N'-diacetyllegionaminic acid synthase